MKSNLVTGEPEYGIDAEDYKRRIERYTRSGYSHLLVYVEKHDSYETPFEDMLPFCSAADAEKWVEGINRKHDAGKNPYRVISHFVRDVSSASVAS